MVLWHVRESQTTQRKGKTMCHCNHGTEIAYCGCEFRFPIPSIHRDEMTEWAMGNIPQDLHCAFLIHFEKPFANTGKSNASAQHFLAFPRDGETVRECFVRFLDGVKKEGKFSHIVNVANARGVKFWVSQVWQDVDSRMMFDTFKARGQFARKCNACR